jgi:hypothetical protein
MYVRAPPHRRSLIWRGTKADLKNSRDVLAKLPCDIGLSLTRCESCAEVKCVCQEFAREWQKRTKALDDLEGIIPLAGAACPRIAQEIARGFGIDIDKDSSAAALHGQ